MASIGSTGEESIISSSVVVDEELTVDHGEESRKSAISGVMKRFGGQALTSIMHSGEEAIKYIKFKWHPYRMLLIGETGSGKTSFLNLLCNSKLFEELGTKVDAAKFNQIKHYNDLKIEDSTARAMASKTSDAVFYYTEVYEMRMEVIDTPGFGDSRGLEQDKKNVKQIIDALRHQDYVNCVCLIINGRQSRMTASLKYVLSEISSILPREIFNNIIVVFTNSADALDCNFDISGLDHYFGRRIDHAFYMYIENPYCRIEKAKQKSGQLSVDQIARSLRKSFEDTAETLRSLQQTIKDFNDVHISYFIFTRLYDKKQEIERDVIIILTSYDQQTELEKEIKITEEEVDAALKSKSLYKDFKTTREVEVVKTVPTPNQRHNTLCGAPGCYSNCHLPCNLPGTETCKVCGHSYRYHYHNEVVFQKVKERKEFVDEAMKAKFNKAANMEQRAKYLKQGLQARREELEHEKDSLLQELNGKMAEFQELGISDQNYVKLWEKQLDIVKLRIETATGTQRVQLNALKEELEKKLAVVSSSLELIKRDTADTEQIIQPLRRKSQEKKAELQKKEVRDARRFHHQLKKKEKEEAKKEQEIQRYRQLLQEKERQYKQQLEENEQTIQALIKNIEEKQQQLEEKEQRFHQQMERKEREEAEKEQEIQRYHHQLQENARELQEKERELRQSQDAVRIYQQQVSTDDHWVINKDEVILTREELGRGSNATVNVGIFRGLRVAVKSLHTLIISDYNLALFSREMSIASRVRHPNLVQFIGATKVGNPLILTELMSTSLHAEIQKNRLTKQQILSIAQDVALGLNYLHLFNPQPIIHRDVSSPNVLLKPSTGPTGYEAKVADYGTANLQKATCTEMPGNAAYAAPEARDPDQHSPAMDVYSYSVLLMEITLHSPPEMTTVKRERQSHNISWSPMKSLIQRGLNTTRQDRPTMSQVIEALKGIKV